MANRQVTRAAPRRSNEGAVAKPSSTDSGRLHSLGVRESHFPIERPRVLFGLLLSKTQDP